LTLNTISYIKFKMIKSFKNKETERVYNREGSKKLPKMIQQTALRKLRMLNNVKNLTDLKTPTANRLEKMKGDRQGQLSIRINDQWRICFIWINRNAHDVEITDYH